MSELSVLADKLLIGRFHRHVFLCIGDSCCTAAAGQESWEALKKEFKDRNLTPGTEEYSCYRTKVGCLRICQDGPIAVVYSRPTVSSGHAQVSGRQ